MKGFKNDFNQSDLKICWTIMLERLYQKKKKIKEEKSRTVFKQFLNCFKIVQAQKKNWS